MPNETAFFIASSAATLAAKGVLFLEPLYPTAPELDQQTVFPCESVTVIIVLLNDANTCTVAEERLRFVLFTFDLREGFEA